MFKEKVKVDQIWYIVDNISAHPQNISTYPHPFKDNNSYEGMKENLLIKKTHCSYPVKSFLPHINN